MSDASASGVRPQLCELEPFHDGVQPPPAGPRTTVGGGSGEDTILDAAEVIEACNDVVTPIDPRT